MYKISIHVKSISFYRNLIRWFSREKIKNFNKFLYNAHSTCLGYKCRMNVIKLYGDRLYTDDDGLVLRSDWLRFESIGGTYTRSLCKNHFVACSLPPTIQRPLFPQPHATKSRLSICRVLRFSFQDRKKEKRQYRIKVQFLSSLN